MQGKSSGTNATQHSPLELLIVAPLHFPTRYRR